MPCGAPLRFRLANAADRGALRAFLDRLSPSTINTRYLTPATTLAGELGERELRRLIERDLDEHLVVVAVDGAEIRGVGEFVTANAQDAELALVVEDAFQHRGIGRCLFGILEQLALERGVSAFTAEVAYSNARMRSLLAATGRRLQTQLGYGSLRFRLLLDPTPTA
jgi:GNAT superfamily N-acetyltransferase